MLLGLILIIFILFFALFVYAEGFWAKAIILAIPVSGFLIFLICSIIFAKRKQASGPADPASRKKLRDHIIRYYNGDIDNFDFDDMDIFDGIESPDPMVEEIIEAAWFLYDDLKIHLWFYSYNKSICSVISVWLYLLGTDMDWKDILKDRPTFKESDYWPFASEEDFKSFIEARPELPEFIKHYPPLTTELITKHTGIRKIRFFKKANFMETRIKEAYETLKKIMEERDEATCKILWEKDGFDFDKSMEQLAKRFPKAGIKKSLPGDSVLFLQDDKDAGESLEQIRKGTIQLPKIKEFFGQ